MINIRKAAPEDAEALYELYSRHLRENPVKEDRDLSLWQKKIARFQNDPSYYLLVGEIDGRIVSTATLVIIENLTHEARPYAVIENVVTHADHRNRHYATALMDKAGEIASGLNCYKIMLMTGSKKESTQKFYENCGFNKNDKTAFIRWL